MKNRNTIIVMALAVTALLVAIVVPVASASPPVVTTITTNFSNSFTADNPCTGVPGTVNLAGRDVLHVTDFGNGIFHMVDTATADLTFTPDDPSAPTFTGHFTNTTFSNQRGQQLTVGGPLTIVAVGTDGSHVVFHLTAQTTLTPDGTVIVSFVEDQIECVPR